MTLRDKQATAQGQKLPPASLPTWTVGQLVSYYRKGWHYGFVDAVEKKNFVWVRPIRPKDAKPKRRIKIPTSYLKKEENVTSRTD